MNPRIPTAPRSIQKGSLLGDLLDREAIVCLAHNITLISSSDACFSPGPRLAGSGHVTHEMPPSGLLGRAGGDSIVETRCERRIRDSCCLR